MPDEISKMLKLIEDFRKKEWRKVRHVTPNFMGSRWHLFECAGGFNFWVHESGEILESSKNKRSL